MAESVSALSLARHGQCVGAVIIGGALSRLELHAAADPSFAPIDAVLPAGSLLEVDGTTERLFVAWVERAGEVQRLTWRAIDQAGRALAQEDPVPLGGNIQGHVVTATTDAFLVLLTDVSPTAKRVTHLFRFTAQGRRFGAPADLREGLNWVTASADPRGSVAVATTAYDAASLVERSVIFSLSWQAVGQPCSTDSQCASGRCGAR